MIDLVFRTPAGGTDLVFGKSEPAAGEVYRVSVSGLFPPLVASMRVAVAYGARVHAVLPDVTAHAVVSYRSEVSRPVVGNLQDDAGPGVAVAVARADRATPADRRQGGAKVAYGEAITLQSSAGVAWQDAAYRDSTLRAVFEDATGLGHSVRTAYQHAIATHQIIASAFEEARREARHLGANYQDALRHARLRIGGAYQEAGRQSSMLAAAGHVASPASHARRHRYQEAMSPGRGIRQQVVIPPWSGYTPDADLLFRQRAPAGPHLVFGRLGEAPAGQLIVPILECYLVINTVSLVRADNGAEIPAEALQIGIGSDGPHWSWSASLPGYARGLVEDRPEVIATLNGTPVRLVVERVRRDRRASLRGVSDAIQIAGRSPSAWLSDPFAPTTARTSENPYTAQQLAAEALTVNGVSMGWALDWRLPDWLVPAGAWSHRGTPMEAVLRVAEAGGGYIQAAAATQTLRALPHYPAAPWLWASLAPDLLLPEDVVEVEGSETAGGAGYDVVYVEGIGPAGRRDRVRRTGTAGVLPAPQIIDPLATDPDMTRARGLAALAASGPQTRVTLRLPVLQETGLILPGTLLDYAAEGATRRGIVRSFRADWTHPELWQSVEVECHG